MPTAESSAVGRDLVRWRRISSRPARGPAGRCRSYSPAPAWARLLLSSRACATPPKKQISKGFWSMKNFPGLIRALLTP